MEASSEQEGERHVHRVEVVSLRQRSVPCGVVSVQD